MKRFNLLSVLLLIFFYEVSHAGIDKESICSNPGNLGVVTHAQCRDLVDLYNSTDGDNWTHNDGWGEGKVDDWHGIFINNEGEFYAIYLNDNNLRGEIKSSLSSLSSVNTIILTDNFLRGQIPEGLFSGLKWGAHIHLRNNQFEGNIPDALSQVTGPAIIDLSYNQLSGNLPDDYFEMRARGVILMVRENQLTGPIPQPPADLEIDSSLDQFPLNLSGNKLSGSIPSNLFKHFRNIYLYNNQLSGMLPDDISDFSGEVLSISNNRLQGPLPDGFGYLKAKRVFLANNKINGVVPPFGEEFSIRSYLDLSNNKLEGNASDLLDQFTRRVYTLNLSHNNLSGTLGSFLGRCIGSLDISFNQISGSLGDLGGNNRSCLGALYLANNNLSGTIDHLSPKLELNKLDLSSNEFSGELPLPPNRYSKEVKLINFSNNKLEGEIPREYLELVNAEIDFRNNRLNDDMTALLDQFEMDKKKGSLELSGQRLFSIASESESLLKPLYSKMDQDLAFFVDVPEAYRVKAVKGCVAKLEGRLLTISANQTNCELRIELESCDLNGGCLVDSGVTARIENANIETPSRNRIMSGVVQLRGWLHEPGVREYKDYDVNNPRMAKLMINNKEIDVNVSLFREDVSSLMGLDQSEFSPIGWSSLFYTGELNNGTHQASLINEEGALLKTLTFSTFTPTDKNGKQSYIHSNKRELEVENFPYTGSRVVLRFSSAEQSFTIIDQFDHRGNSTRSNVHHYSEDDKQPRYSGLFNGVSKVRIEAPNNSNPLLGVSSIRGWAYSNPLTLTTRSLFNGTLWLSIDDGEPYVVSRDERADVEAAMGVELPARVGWSQLIYAGSLANGRHRLRLYGEENGERHLLAQSFFESFVPLDEEGKRVYIQRKKAVSVPDFPYDGSTVSLEFDGASQNFMIVGQKSN